MKKLFYSFVFIFILLFSPLNMSADCLAGGYGSTSCTYSFTTEFMGATISSTTTTTCGDGFYACCWKSGSKAKSGCFKNPSNSGSNQPRKPKAPEIQQVI